MNNIDINSFTKSANEKSSKKAAQGSKKSKNNKGLDFVEYAQKNGLNYNIQYEEKDVKEKKPYQQYNKPSNPTSNQTTYGTQPAQYQNKPYNNEYKQQGQSNNNNNNFKKNKPKKPRNNNNFPQANEGVSLGVNKFDSFGFNPMMMYNPYMFSQMAQPNRILTMLIFRYKQNQLQD